MRPARLVVLTGTGTEVGKTWVSAAVLGLARRSGWSVAARKPAQSFDPGAGPTDADLLASASGEPPDRVCPPHRWYPYPLAPPMAAEKLGLVPPTIADLAAEVDGSWPVVRSRVGLVEGAGGVASPLASDGDTGDLARRLGADGLILVADPALGVIHSVRLARLALPPVPTVVYLNRFDASEELHRLNRQWLAERDGCTVATSPPDVLSWLEHLAWRHGVEAAK